MTTKAPQLAPNRDKKTGAIMYAPPLPPPAPPAATGKATCPHCGGRFNPSGMRGANEPRAARR